MKLPGLTLVPNVIVGAATGGPVDVMAKLFLKDVDGELTIGEIGDNLGLPPELAQRIALSLLERGLVEIPGFALEPSPAVKPAEAAAAKQAQDEISVKTDKTRILEADADELYGALNTKNFYEMLDTEPDASRADLRSKYFALSKRFHPDKAFGDTTGELRRKMEVIFRHLTQAYDILSNPQSRADYDSSIADIIEMWAIEKKLKSAIDASTGKKPAPEKQPDTAPEKPPPAGRKPVVGALKKTLKFRPVTLKKNGRDVSKIPSHPPQPHYEERRRQWKRERAGRAMAVILGKHSNAPPSIGKAKLRIHEAEIAMEQDRFAEAVRLLQEAVSIDPENENALEMLEKARAGSIEALAKEHVSKGLFEQRQGNLTVAIKHFDQACEIDVKNLDARHLLAEALLQAQKDLPRALTLIKDVVGMGGQRARYFATLGDILLLAKDPERAGEAYEKAVSMAPNNKEYKKKLKACKK
jgi:tetratricopeptide (TPR) repeat protein